MFSTPIPRRSFLDSRLRSQSLETRRLERGHATGSSHLGLGSRTTTRSHSDRTRVRNGYDGHAAAGL